MHSSVGMEGGTFFFGKKGDPIDKYETVELEEFVFFKDSKKEVLPGFTPSESVCFYNTNSSSWNCSIHSSWNDVRKTISKRFQNDPKNDPRTFEN